MSFEMAIPEEVFDARDMWAYERPSIGVRAEVFFQTSRAIECFWTVRISAW